MLSSARAAPRPRHPGPPRARRRDRGRRDPRRGRGLGGGLARVERGPRGSGRLRRRRLLEQPEDDPRRPAPPAAARRGRTARVGARAAGPHDHRARRSCAPSASSPWPRAAGCTDESALALGVAAAGLLSRDLQRGAAPGAPQRRTVGRGRSGGPRARPGQRRREGGALWWDAQVDSSERLVLALLHAAADAGAVVANRLTVTGVRVDEETIVGVVAQDALTGAHDRGPRAEAVLNAPGSPWTASPRGRSAPAKVTRLRAVNLVLRRAIARDVAMGVRSGGRYLFAVPWRDRTILGTGVRAGRDAGAGPGRRVPGRSGPRLLLGRARSGGRGARSPGRRPGSREGQWSPHAIAPRSITITRTASPAC